jgi:hypothetical protein
MLICPVRHHSPAAALQVERLIRERRPRAVLVARAEPEDATVLVVAERKVSPGLRRAVRDALRPFISSNPDAEQVPGDLQEEPTRIDTSASDVFYWAGPKLEGFTASIVADAPPGAGVVSYTNGQSEWFIVSYTPRKKKHCGQTGCVSPPPLPAALERYGEVADTILLGERVVVVLAERPDRVPSGAHISERLKLVR